MNFPLDIWDISLLLAIIAFILLVTSEMFSPYYGRINIQINRRHLRNAAFTTSILFLVTVGIRIVSIILRL